MPPRQGRHPTGASAPISREPVGLDADTIVTTALALLDEHGVAALTTRALCARLSVSPPTIYWHVGSKAGLLEAIVERVVTTMTATSPGDDTWENQLRHFLHAARQQLLSHPNVMEIMRSVHSRAFERWATAAFDIMKKAGFHDSDAATYARSTLFHALGCAHAEAAARMADYIEPALDKPGELAYRVKPELLREGIDPRIALMTSYDIDKQHEIMTDIFVAGLRVHRDRTHQQ